MEMIPTLCMLPILVIMILKPKFARTMVELNSRTLFLVTTVLPSFYMLKKINKIGKHLICYVLFYIEFKCNSLFIYFFEQEYKES